jgi:uncharacterized membrane protein YqhA
MPRGRAIGRAEGPLAEEPVEYDRAGMVRDILGTSRFLIILAVLGTFVASATLQVFGLLRVAAVIVELVRAGDVTAAASKGLIADTVAIIDIFLIGTVLFVISAGLYQLFVHADLPLPGWLKVESLDDLKDNLTEVIIVALLVAFLGQAVEWTGDFAILGLGLAVATVIVAVGVLTWAARARG